MIVCLLAGCGRKEPEVPSPTLTPEPTPTVDPHEGMVEVTDGAGGTRWIDEAEALTPFGLNRYAFSVTDGLVNYSEDGVSFIRGIDVSEYQHEIDWQAVAASGVQFAIIRIGWRGYGEGNMYPDETYRANIEGAQAAGIKVGAYFFSQSVSLMEGAAEAIYAAQLLDGYTLDLPVFFDWEMPAEEARTNGADPALVTAAALEFCRLLESEGYQAGIYTYIPDVYTRYDLNQLAGITIWMGDPGNYPEFYYEHDYWQYSFTGSIPGIEGDVDLDVIYVRGGQNGEVTVPVENTISENTPGTGTEASG